MERNADIKANRLYLLGPVRSSRSRTRARWMERLIAVCLLLVIVAVDILEYQDQSILLMDNLQGHSRNSG